MLLRNIKNLFLGHYEYLPAFKKRFASFGSSSCIQQPSIISEHQYILIGNNTSILSGARIQVFNALTDKNSKVKIGDNCYFCYNLSILAGGNITIGDNVLIASNVFITSQNHGINPECDIPYMNQPLVCKDVVIGDGCWIGEKASILPGVTIGKKCVIGTNAVVTKDIPDYSMAAGIPAKVIKRYCFERHEWVKV